ncbi:MAG: hypothetical protein JWM64_2754 [Frankiales bacterium]|nr:hypothetical protein [Frankiales bacterium]
MIGGASRDEPVRGGSGPVRPPPHPARAPSHPGPVRAGPAQLAGPMSAPALQRLGGMIGNKRVAGLFGPATEGRPVLQRVPVSYADSGETLYEDAPTTNPDGSDIAAPTSAQKQFVPTPYSSGTIAYEMTRDADVTVTVKVLFLDQARDEDRFLTDPTTGKLVLAAGKKQPNPAFGSDTGKVSEIKDAARLDFARSKCASIGSAWNHYALQSKTVPPATPPPATPTVGTGPAAPGPKELSLPLKFEAKPFFDPAMADAHAQIRLFGAGVEADRDGAHPIDSGHWYTQTKKNYGGMDLDAVAAHEYGHLVGLADEYSRSDDQTHQLLHRMGGGAKNADKLLDQHTLKQMVTLAVAAPIQARMRANLKEVQDAFLGAKDALRKQLVSATRSAWSDPGLREGLVKQIAPVLKTAALRGQLPSVVDFQTGQNFSNLQHASEAMEGFTSGAIGRAVMDAFTSWRVGAMGDDFSATGADGSSVSVSTEYSANVGSAATTGGAKDAGAALAGRVVGGGAGGTPKIAPSPGLMAQLAALPAEWKDPAKGLGATYTGDLVRPQITAAVDGAIANGSLPKAVTSSQLFTRVLNLVRSTARVTTRDAVDAFVFEQVEPRVSAQLSEVTALVAAEVDSVLGMPAGALAAKSPPDPQVQAIAAQLHSLLKAQQNAATYDQKADVSPGGGAAGQDVRHTAATTMGTNDVSKLGHRADMIDPVVAQFNAHLRKTAEEEAFTAKVIS